MMYYLNGTLLRSQILTNMKLKWQELLSNINQIILKE